MLFTTLCCFACKRHSGLNENNRGSEAFAFVLRDRIEDFISYVDSISPYKNKNEFFYVFFEEENDKMFVFVGTDFLLCIMVMIAIESKISWIQLS